MSEFQAASPGSWWRKEFLHCDIVTFKGNMQDRPEDISSCRL